MTRNALITGVGWHEGSVRDSRRTGGRRLGSRAVPLEPYDDRLGMEWQPDDPDLLADELRSLGRRIELIPADLEDPAAADALVYRAGQQLGPLDALVMSHCER
jgi:3-oxoacyl-[acyl-carrier protein] reductase